MAATQTPYPPSHPHHTSSPLSPSTALHHLKTYLSLSETQPHLHPDAQLDPREIRFSTTGGPSGGLVLHNLRRVEKGLEGEVLAPEVDELNEIFGGGGAAAAEDEMVGGKGPAKTALKRTSAYEGLELLDPVEYARSQAVLEGDVGVRDTADAEAFYDAAREEEAYEGGAGGMTQREKEARKEEKKKRRKAEQRAKAEKKA
ncbi:hypothetical protein AAFC00_002649 [Neodothiora populina]|uniref:Uncharacterized protein n=1 Tax=Neodothiora populina TaxID=2781224 RepID=A0ABR3P870_9PEZI